MKSVIAGGLSLAVGAALFFAGYQFGTARASADGKSAAAAPAATNLAVSATNAVTAATNAVPPIERRIAAEERAAATNRVARPVNRPPAKPRDLEPEVRFAARGRYLPPIGERVIGVETVNVSNLECAVRYVLPENIVQLLAREEYRYVHSVPWWRNRTADSAMTEEIASAPVEWKETLKDGRNVRVTHPIALGAGNGVVSNGVYLVSVRNGDFWDGSPKYRLVCMTELGLSIRRDGHSCRVWVTSLLTGRPMGGLRVELYASNRLLLASGTTGSDGEVTLSGWDERYRPFAVIAAKPDGTDSAFAALGDSMEIDESLPCGRRPWYLGKDVCQAFVWTDRGIYRHGEKLMLHALLRDGDGDAPEPFPVTVGLEKPNGETVASVTKVLDRFGAVAVDDFVIPMDEPSGRWRLTVSTPGDGGFLIGDRSVKVEDFVPPQIRVTLGKLPAAGAPVTNLVFDLKAEHLFGGPARGFAAECHVSFADAQFAPAKWKDFRFGDPRTGLSPNFAKLEPSSTDDDGRAVFRAELPEQLGRPAAAVKMSVQCSVFEPGGRPAVVNGSTVVHRYPCYLGSDIPDYVRRQLTPRAFRVVRVGPDGEPCRTAGRLRTSLSKLEHVYSLRELPNRSSVWDSETVRRPVAIAESAETDTNGIATVELPLDGSGDYEFAVEDVESGVTHSVTFWISSDGDDEERASLRNPTAVEIVPDRKLYREGDRPRLTVKSPFRGTAWMAVMRDRTLSTRVFELTNLTSVVELEPLDRALAPNIDVAISVVQSVTNAGEHLAARAHGIVPLRIRTRDSELRIALDASVRTGAEGGSEVSVKLDARGERAVGERAVVTVVDEGVNLLTREPVPDPVGFLSTLRCAMHPLYDLYGRLLPVWDSKLKVNGVKTGGGSEEGLMKRVSPVPSRRFRPLSLWKLEVPLADGRGEASFRLPEFVGEVRVTAVAYEKRATGAASARLKVCPKLVMQPDAPRFVAPGDEFDVTLALVNRAGADGEVKYAVGEGNAGELRLRTDDATNIVIRMKAPKRPGQLALAFVAEGFGERHTASIELPVRPAVGWEESATVVALKPGEEYRSANVTGEGSMPEATRRTFTVSASPVAELKVAFDYLAEYPHGCLEQTTSRMFPLVNGSDILAVLERNRPDRSAELKDIVEAGISRVVSMVRVNDFTMWPDVNCPPWDREVSLYAAHFLVEAKAAGYRVNSSASEHVLTLLRGWACDRATNISVYACHTLALAGCPDRDRMNTLYDLRAKLTLLDRARLSRAFARTGEPKRARALVADPVLMPADVKEAAFALIALLELDSGDPRIAKLVLYLQDRRDRRRYDWGTTGDNAHALMALGAYYRTRKLDGSSPKVTVRSQGGRPEELAVGAVKLIEGCGELVVRNEGSGDAFVATRRLALPETAAVANDSSVLEVSRRFFRVDGSEADLTKLVRGELLIGEITLSADRDLETSDLVIEDLFPGGFDPDRQAAAESYAKVHGRGQRNWTLRSDCRDDRVLVFSKPVKFRKNATDSELHRFYYAVRVTGAGEFVLPGTRVEAMYTPEIHAVTEATRLSIVR